MFVFVPATGGVMNTTLLWQQFLNGLAIGSVYAIFALGYTLVFSILRVINFAHGAIFTLGAYFTYMLLGARFGFNGVFANLALPFSLPFPLALLLGAILAGLIGVVIASLVNILLGSTMLQMVVSIAGVIVFTGLTAWDTQSIKERYAAHHDHETAGKLAVFGALSLYLNFVNIFQLLLNFTGERE